MKIDISTVFGLLGVICTIASFFIGRMSAAKNDGEHDGTMTSDLGYVKAGIDDIKAEQKEQRKTNTEFVSRLTAVEESTKQAHKRIDRIEHGTERSE